MKNQENKVIYFVLERNEKGNPIDYIKSVGDGFIRCKYIDKNDIPEISEQSLQEVTNFNERLEKLEQKMKDSEINKLFQDLF